MPAPTDDALQEMARNRGFRLVRSRVRTPGRKDYGKYGLERLGDGEKCLGFGKDRLTATREEIEAFLRKQGNKGWSRSVTGTPARKAEARSKTNPKPPEPSPKARPKKTEPRAEPAEAPPPRPVEIRAAEAADLAAIRKLLREIGTPSPALGEWLKAAKAEPMIHLVAADDNPVGYAAAILLPAPHAPHPLGRILTLIVDPTRRREGIATSLLDALEQWLRKQGCRTIEAVAEIDYSGAGALFRARGYGRSTYRFDKHTESVKP